MTTISGRIVGESGGTLPRAIALRLAKVFHSLPDRVEAAHEPQLPVAVAVGMPARRRLRRRLDLLGGQMIALAHVQIRRPPHRLPRRPHPLIDHLLGRSHGLGHATAEYRPVLGELRRQRRVEHANRVPRSR